jgi:hypothetical protein
MLHRLGTARPEQCLLQIGHTLQKWDLELLQMYLPFWQMPLLRLVLGTNSVVARFCLLFYT